MCFVRSLHSVWRAGIRAVWLSGPLSVRCPLFLFFSRFSLPKSSYRARDGARPIGACSFGNKNRVSVARPRHEHGVITRAPCSQNAHKCTLCNVHARTFANPRNLQVSASASPGGTGHDQIGVLVRSNPDPSPPVVTPRVSSPVVLVAARRGASHASSARVASAATQIPRCARRSHSLIC